MNANSTLIDFPETSQQRLKRTVRTMARANRRLRQDVEEFRQTMAQLTEVTSLIKQDIDDYRRALDTIKIGKLNRSSRRLATIMTRTEVA